MKRAAAYIRVSTDEQEEYSPESQLKLIRNYAEKSGYTLPESLIFQDDGISASSVQKRQKFNEMIALAKSENKPFDVILVWKFSRFARNREESVLYKGLLRKRGISVVSISEPITDGPFGTLIESIIEWFDEYYLINLSAEVKRGMTEKFSRGEAMGTAPFGYIIDSKNKTYVPDTEKTPIVKDIFESYLNGEKIRQIAIRLNESGIRTNRGNLPDNRFISYILHNPVYIGKIRWSQNGRTSAKYVNSTAVTETTEGKQEPIIDISLWNRVQEKLEKENLREIGCYPNADWALKGIMHCSVCGATLVKKNGNTPSVQCYNYSHGVCRTSHYVTLEKANQTVFMALISALGELRFDIKIHPKKEKNVTINYEKLLKNKEKMLNRCKEAYKRGIDSLGEYSENKAAINAEIGEIKKQIAKAEKLHSQTLSQEKTVSITEFIKNPNVTESAKNTALRAIISRIVFSKTETRLLIYFFI